jgi:hypothetical protein
MKTYADKVEVEYQAKSSTDDHCGACVYLNMDGNAITCDRIAVPNNRVYPQAVCKLFKSILGEDEWQEADPTFGPKTDQSNWSGDGSAGSEPLEGENAE